MENPIKMDDLGVPLFLETSIYIPQKNLSLHLFTTKTPQRTEAHRANCAKVKWLRSSPAAEPQAFRNHGREDTLRG